MRRHLAFPFDTADNNSVLPIRSNTHDLYTH